MNIFRVNSKYFCAKMKFIFPAYLSNPYIARFRPIRAAACVVRARARCSSTRDLDLSVIDCMLAVSMHGCQKASSSERAIATLAQK